VTEGLDGVDCHAHASKIGGPVRSQPVKMHLLRQRISQDLARVVSIPRGGSDHMQPVDCPKIEGMPNSGEASLGDIVPGASNAGKCDQTESWQLRQLPM
jgi:hypothetical protein